jgi:LysR family transcriptional activator of nhaA
VVPKLVAYQLIEPALRLKDAYRIVCREGTNAELLPALAVHDIDVVLTDAPVEAGINVKAFHHLLGECEVLLFASTKLAGKYRRGFPRSLDGAPFLLPTRNTISRRSLDQWFDHEKIQPKIIAEFEDNALLMAFGQHGIGIFVAPSVIRNEVERKYAVQVIGQMGNVRERFFAVSLDRKLRHPAVVAISEAARAWLPD